MKKRFASAMLAVSLASGLLSFGKSNGVQVPEEPLLRCPGDCCSVEQDDSKDSCCKDTEMCCE